MGVSVCVGEYTQGEYILVEQHSLDLVGLLVCVYLKDEKSWKKMSLVAFAALLICKPGVAMQ